MPTKAEGLTFMFTGRISVTRKTAQEAVVRAGGIPGSSVCSTTDYLVVGDKPGSKIQKAEYWDVPLLTEDEFWDMLKEYEQELEPEEWEEHGIIVLDEKAFLLMLDLLEWKQAVDEKERMDKEEQERRELWEPKSWEDMGILNSLFAEYSDVAHELQGPSICPHCNWIIPYSVHSPYYYCFNCNCYTDSKHGGFIWEQHPDMPVYEHGMWQKCRISGKVRFVEKDDISKSDEFRRKVNFSHSAEFSLPIRRNCRLRTPSVRTGQQILATKTAEEVSKLYEEWRTYTEKKEQRRLNKLRERNAKQQRALDAFNSGQPHPGSLSG